MKCNDFDAHIDEMLSGILHPDANQHMRQCERCTSHLRARTAVQNGLRQLAAASPSGPSRATDRAVMDAYRRMQQNRVDLEMDAAPLPAGPRLLSFPRRSPVPARDSRAWRNGIAAAAMFVAVLGSGVHLWRGVSTVHAPTTASAPSALSPQSAPSGSPADRFAAASNLASRHPSLRQSQSHPGLGPIDDSPSNDGQGNEVAASLNPASAVSSQAAAAPAAPPILAAASGNGSVPVMQANAAPQSAAAPPSVGQSPIMHLASAEAASNVAGAASSTWPGYSNLVYCDPVECSGPMQVVHIKVPVNQVKPNVGQSGGNGFVNAEVVVGPDGVARAIRVAN